MAEPKKVTAGDTWSWTRTEPRFPASAGWVLTYYLAAGAEPPKVVACTALGDAHALVLSAAATGSWNPGAYHWTARVVLGEEVETLDQGLLHVLPDPTSAYDRRTTEEKCLDAVTAVLERRVGDSIIEYELPDGVKAKHKTDEELLRLQAHYRTAVRLQRGGRMIRTIPVRFR